eukprot:Unigene15259_Nuclearia_a/m.45644 Unigene15259_Nuclearia_a/g.45644  ORF Unigene15259_Nuclearia_a/g.45644 Unigene15259_Nuclearia_a/m.45644 type:complete len:358 (+) Unigene15259_Nuclearia_a:324-1397(+)
MIATSKSNTTICATIASATATGAAPSQMTWPTPRRSSSMPLIPSETVSPAAAHLACVPCTSITSSSPAVSGEGFAKVCEERAAERARQNDRGAARTTQQTQRTVDRDELVERRHNHDPVAHVHIAGLDLAANKDPAAVARAEHVRDAQAQRLVDGPLGHAQPVDVREQRRARVPPVQRRIARHAPNQVLARQARARHKPHVLVFVAGLPQECAQLGDDLVEARLGPVKAVELVDGHDELRHAQAADKQRVLLGLPVALKAGLKLARVGVDHEQRHVGLRRARDHVGHKVAVAGRVEQRNVLGRRVKVRRRDVYRHAALALLVCLVEHPRKRKRALANLLRVALVLLHRLVGHLAEQV